MGSGMSHAGIAQDQMTRKLNEKESKPLCERCKGTGNELYAMYRKCKACGGSGVKPKSL